MPLSEHEERILAEIERQLADEDPRFVARARRRHRGRPAGRWSRTARLRLAAVLAIVGIIGVFSLVISIILGAAGMVLIFGAIVLAVTTAKEAEEAARASVPPDEHA